MYLCTKNYLLIVSLNFSTFVSSSKYSSDRDKCKKKYTSWYNHGDDPLTKKINNTISTSNSGDLAIVLVEAKLKLIYIRMLTSTWLITMWVIMIIILIHLLESLLIRARTNFGNMYKFGASHAVKSPLNFHQLPIFTFMG